MARRRIEYPHGREGLAGTARKGRTEADHLDARRVEGTARSVRRAAREGVERAGRRTRAGPAHAGSVHGARQRLQDTSCRLKGSQSRIERLRVAAGAAFAGRAQSDVGPYVPIGLTQARQNASPMIARPARRSPESRSGVAGVVVGRAGLEPATKGLCVPLRLSPPVSGSWSGLCLAFRPSRRVSTRSPSREFRSALAWRARHRSVHRI
jgi:hypothetical protein